MKKINFISPIKSQMGYAQMARLIWPALKQAGKVGCHDIGMQQTSAELGACTKDMLSHAINQNPDVTIVNMVPILWDRMSGPGKKIGYTTFEANKLPGDWVKIINNYDCCWTTSAWNRDVMQQSGVLRPIHVVTPIAKQCVVKQPSGKFTFLSSFQWSERKNPYGLIKSFCAAFDGNTDVKLVIKTHVGSNASDSHATVTKAIAGMVSTMKLKKQPDISVNCNIESSAFIEDLNAMSHAHINLSHGEGWGLPAWEAALAAKPVIATGWSAPAEWLGASYPFKVRYNLSPVCGMEKEIAPFFDISMSWAEPHIDDAVDKLRYVFKNYDDSKAIAERRAMELLNEYSEDRTLSSIVNSL